MRRSALILAHAFSATVATAALGFGPALAEGAPAKAAPAKSAAATAVERAIATSRKVAGDPEVWVDYAEAVGMAEGRTLRGRPEALVAKALELDPANVRALELAGSLAMEKGDALQAARHWQRALDRLDAADPRRADLAQAVARVAGLAGPRGMTKR